MPPPSPRDLLALAVAADVAPNTVRRRFSGLPMQPATRRRVEQAARKMGLRLPRRLASVEVRQGGR